MWIGIHMGSELRFIFRMPSGTSAGHTYIKQYDTRVLEHFNNKNVKYVYLPFKLKLDCMEHNAFPRFLPSVFH